jgi:hypothetical protein
VAQQAFEKGDLVTAKSAFNTGLTLWRAVIDKNPEIIEDRTVGDDLADVCKDYIRLLGKRDEALPKHFILQDVLDRYGKDH